MKSVRERRRVARALHGLPKPARSKCWAVVNGRGQFVRGAEDVPELHQTKREASIELYPDERVVQVEVRELPKPHP